MEPMALGSAPSSPSTPGTNPNFLPSFLMGDEQQILQTSTLSPHISKSFLENLTPSEKGTIRQRLFNPSPVGSGIATPSTQKPSTSASVQKSGPPMHSLFDTLDVSKTSTVEWPTSPLSPPASDAFSRSLHLPRKNDSFSVRDTIRSDDNYNMWVTVFGFPTNSASIVLGRMAQCGPILDKKFPTQGNWIHLKYNSPIEVSKALAMNGKLISSGIMIGVVPFYNAQEDKENKDVPLYASPPRARALRHSYVSPQHSNTVLSSSNLPKKSTGLVTKAMEYMFGW